MTAEIALVNRSALAFAADSAVTIRVGTAQKIYDSAEKIFELSRRQPIALMIYNNVEFHGVPLDVLIRKYRAECSSIFNSISEQADNFLSYLKEFDDDARHESNFLFNMLYDYFGRIHSEVLKRFEAAAKNPPKDVAPRTFISSTLDEIIDRYTRQEHGRSLDGFLSDIEYPAFLERFSKAIDAAISLTIAKIPVSDQSKEKFQRLAFAILKSRRQSGQHTGLVFGGFAANDLFPCLIYIEIDGSFYGHVKVLSRKTVIIDTKTSRAQMVPFAQKEMADRFIYGLDGAFRSTILKYVDSAATELIKATSPKGRRSKKSIKETELLKETTLSKFKEMIDRLMVNERRNILDMLNFMSKKELGDFAHALVELTSKKRRFSADDETVGGPIDVAIITRNEGFIWIRRKHYFDREANPGYYARVFGQSGEGPGKETIDAAQEASPAQRRPTARAK